MFGTHCQIGTAALCQYHRPALPAVARLQAFLRLAGASLGCCVSEGARSWPAMSGARSCLCFSLHFSSASFFALLPRARPQVGFLYPVPPGDTDVCQDSRADDDKA